MELEKIEANFGYPPRRGRKWLRRNNVDIVETHTTVEGAETKASKETNEKAEKVEEEKADGNRKKKKTKIKRKKAVATFLIDCLD